MLNFEYDNKTKIVFGKDTENQVGELTKQYGKKVLLHYGGGSIKKYGLYDKIVESLQKENIEYVELGGVVPNPRLSKVREGIELCRKENVDFILAVGGGSVIDSAKAIAVGATSKDDIWEYFIMNKEIKNVLPIGVVLTIPAAGSESSTGTVITNEDGLLKRSFGHPTMRPVFSILNPELTYTLPNYQTAAGAVDMIGHVIERYITNTDNVELTDRLCESVMRTVVSNASKAIAANNDYASRAELMWAGALAHNGLIGTGREADWASHGIEHELSAIYDLTHGAGLSIIYPAWMKYVYKNDLNRFALFAHKVFDVENSNDTESMALEGIRKLEEFYKSIEMPIRMIHAEIDDTHIQEMANKATNNNEHTIGSFVKLNKEDIVNIYKLALK